MKTFFIYGFNGTEKDSQVAGKIIPNLICFKYNSKLYSPIEEIAQSLKIFLSSKTKKNEKVNLIGISAGGIIVDYYSKFINSKKVSKIATICSPFQGSYIPLFYSKKHKGLKELSYGSNFLKRLNSRKPSKNKTINFYSFLDILVPFNSGKGKNPKHTWNFFHFTIQRDKKIINRIKRFFEE